MFYQLLECGANGVIGAHAPNPVSTECRQGTGSAIVRRRPMEAKVVLETAKKHASATKKFPAQVLIKTFLKEEAHLFTSCLNQNL